MDTLKVNVNVNIFILCYNEQVLLPKTIEHYRKYLPNCNITIYDNESTDNSVNIAQELGCNIISWNSGNKIDDYKYLEIKNNCWKKLNDSWVIMIDMDEWLCVSENDLLNEQLNGTSVLQTRGYNIVGESNSATLDDIDIHSLAKGVYKKGLSKLLCFYRPKIINMNYEPGAHVAKPIGTIKYSKKEYINKHMSLLGLPFYSKKMHDRYVRSHEMQKKGLATHYTDNNKEIKERHDNAVNTCEVLPPH